MIPRAIAIDWSGALAGAKRRIWLAEVERGRVLRLASGRDRSTIADHLVHHAGRMPELVVGLDFAFSFPAWFLRQRGLASAHELWDLIDREGEQWLAECCPPLWGRPGRGRPAMDDPFRRTDREVPAVGGIRPKSVFQIGGAGAVGTGSIRGMPLLKRLRDAGFAVWPFDEPRLPFVIEIYPRALTGAVTKGSEAERRAYLDTRCENLPPHTREDAAQSEDAFDALISALVMDRHADSWASLARGRPEDVLEGRIWLPPPGVAVSSTVPMGHDRARP